MTERVQCSKHPGFILPCLRCKKESGEPEPKKARHKWVYPQRHVYVCKVCGMRKRNEERERGWWVTSYRSPEDGIEREFEKVPPCKPGALTAEFIAEYQDAIDQNMRKIGDRPEPDPSTLLPDDWEPPF